VPVVRDGGPTRPDGRAAPAAKDRELIAADLSQGQPNGLSGQAELLAELAVREPLRLQSDQLQALLWIASPAASQTAPCHTPCSLTSGPERNWKGRDLSGMLGNWATGEGRNRRAEFLPGRRPRICPSLKSRARIGPAGSVIPRQRALEGLPRGGRHGHRHRAS